MYVTSDIYETDRYETENPRKQKFPFRAVYNVLIYMYFWFL